LRIGFHFPWRNTVTRQLAHIFCTVANQLIQSTQIGSLHFFIRRDFSRRSFGKHAPLMHHRNGIGNAHHHVHVVFHQHDGFLTTALNVLDERNQFGHLFGGHSGGRFVEQQHLRIRRQDHAQFQFALIAMRQGARRCECAFFQPHLLDHLPGARFIPFEMRCWTPELEVVAARRLRCQTDVLENGEIGKDVGNLERTTDAQMNGSVDWLTGDVAPLEQNLSAGRFQVAAQQVEQRGFPRAVGTDNGMQRTSANPDTHTIHRYQRTKGFGQAASFENNIGIHAGVQRYDAFHQSLKELYCNL
jgi:hypothetical protein